MLWKGRLWKRDELVELRVNLESVKDIGYM